ncbi:MAG: hypothetical protein Ct9H90mP30_3060 [Actinomycetota bacterium]|nr:MAG: hypothetical protein Ct9H90mP30_3060 [Actinomycetota bacterium]
MANLNVGVFGAAGKMGATTCQAINSDDSMTLRLGVDANQVGTLSRALHFKYKEGGETGRH